MILVAEDIGLALLIGWVFYNNLWASIPLLIPVSYLNGNRYYEKHDRRRQENFIAEYKELLKNIISGLETGFSVENTFVEAEKLHLRLYGSDSVLLSDLHAVNAAVKLRTPIETAFEEFAARHPYEEVTSFASVFSFGKRLGGNYIDNLRATARKLEEKVGLKQEIAATIAQKRLELSVMSVMPMLIITYMKISSGDFMSPMYDNLLGRIVMSGCVLVYAAARVLGKKVISIEV